MNETAKQLLIGKVTDVRTNEIAKQLPIGTVTAARTERLAPDAYRLLQKKDGTLVLQGAYYWTQGARYGGYEWRDIPTVVEA